MTEEHPYAPPLPWRLASAATTGVTGILCRSFLYAFNRTETSGLDRFLAIMDQRANPAARQRGLITVSNHVSVIDDPLLWGTLPFAYHFNPQTVRWSLASFDVCFPNRFVATFFTYGQTLPTHRQAHSKYGGLWQSTMTQAIRLLSDPCASEYRQKPLSGATTDKSSLPPSDPFSSSLLTYTTNGKDCFPAPAAYQSRRHAWIHIFPEGRIHQHPAKIMRYWKWGVARLVLESEPCPDVLPIFIDGFQQVMNENRTWPRPLPRGGADIKVTFGEIMNREGVLEPFRQRWRDLQARARAKRKEARPAGIEEQDELLGIVHDDWLRYGDEAVELRKEVTLALRREVLKVRISTGLPDEDPKATLVETWQEEGSKYVNEGRMADGSIVKNN